MFNCSFCKHILISLVAFILACSGCQEQQTSVPIQTEPVAPAFEVDENKTNAVHLYVEAMMLEEIQKWNKAIEKLNESIQHAPEFALAYSYRGDLYQLTKEYEKSADSYDYATKIDPWSFKDFSCLGKVSVILEDYRRAVNAYVSACELDPEHYEVHLGAAKCFFKLEDYDQAFGYGKRSKELGPEFADPDVLLGDIYDAREDYAAAVDSYRRALEIKGNDPKIMVPLAVSYVKMNRFEAAEELLNQAIKLDKSSNIAYQYLGYVQLQLYKGELDRAFGSFKKALEIDPQDWMAHKGVGVVYMLKYLRTKNPTEKKMAINEWDVSLNIKPDQPELKKMRDTYAGAGTR